MYILCYVSWIQQSIRSCMLIFRSWWCYVSHYVDCGYPGFVIIVVHGFGRVAVKFILCKSSFLVLVQKSIFVADDRFGCLDLLALIHQLF